MTVRFHTLFCTDKAELGCKDGDQCAWCPLRMPAMRWSDLFGSASASWVKDAYHWRGHAMLGKYAHWCPDWDFLPIDEDCLEWPCPCSMSDGWIPKDKPVEEDNSSQPLAWLP